MSMNRAVIIRSRPIILNTIVWIAVHEMVVGPPFEQSLALKSKHQVTSPELAALQWNLLSLDLDNVSVSSINLTQKVGVFD